MTFQNTLDNIRNVVLDYRSEKVFQDVDYKAMHRKLSSNLYFLNEHRVQFKKLWDGYYAECKEKTNASKARFADRMCQELYMARKLYEAGEHVLISINNQLKY